MTEYVDELQEDVEEDVKNQYGMDDDVFQYLENLSNLSSASNRVRGADHRALAIMLELVKSQRATFLLLRDDDISKWWGKKVSLAETRVNNWKREMSDYQIKIAAYDRLTPSERRALGIRKPTKPADLGLQEIT